MAKGLSGYMVSFASVKDVTLGELFGTAPVAATQLMKKLWAIIKDRRLKVANVVAPVAEVPYKVEPVANVTPVVAITPPMVEDVVVKTPPITDII